MPQSYWIKYITRIRIGLSHLQNHKFKHSFWDSIHLICNCFESVIHYFFDCSLYNNERCALLNSLSKIDHKLLDSADSFLTQTFLFGNSSFTTNSNTKIVTLAINFVLSTNGFDGHFYELWFFFPLSFKQLLVNQHYIIFISNYFNLFNCRTIYI